MELKFNLIIRCFKNLNVNYLTSCMLTVVIVIDFYDEILVNSMELS